MTTGPVKRFATVPWEHPATTAKPTFRTGPFFPAGDPRNDHEGLVPTRQTEPTPASRIIAIPGLKLPPYATPRTA